MIRTDQMLDRYLHRFTWRADIVVLAIVSSIVFFTSLGGNYHWASREIRHAEIIREMVATGDYLIPRCMGEVYVDKPPVFHWVGAALMKWNGPSLFAARFPLAAAALVGVLATYALGAMTAGRSTALIGAGALAGMPLYVIMARQARPDMFLAAAILLSALCLACGGRSQAGMRRNILFLLAGIFSGIAVITKGPYGILFPSIFFGVIAYRERSGGRQLLSAIPPFLAGLALPIVLWAVPVYLRDQGHYLRSVLTQHDLANPGGHRRPFYWYFGPLILTAMPYLSFVPWAVKRWRQQGSSVFLITAGTMFLVLSCVPSKRNHYLLPLFPFLALGIAEAVAHYALTHRGLAKALVLVIPFSWLGHAAYFGGYLPIWHRDGDPEYVFARQACERLSAQTEIVCQQGIDEEIAWVQRRFANIHSVSDAPSTAAKLRQLGPGTLLAYDRKQMDPLIGLLPMGSLRELLGPVTASDKQWTLYRYAATP